MMYLLKYKTPMEMTPSAEKRLTSLLPPDANGFAVTGFVGSCRGSTPVMHPAKQADPSQKTVKCGQITFYVKTEITERFEQCSLDYDRSFFGKGLTASWPECDECACHS